MNQIISAIGLGFLWSILAIGLFITFRILNFPDMTVEGTFPLGASVCVAAITHGVSPLVATLLAMGGGMLCGLVTGLLHTKGKIPVLLAGILVMTGVYSINLHILGKATVGLLNYPTIFSSGFLPSLKAGYDVIVLGFIISCGVVLLLCGFFYTEKGQGLIATGDNEKMAQALGIKPSAMKLLGLILGNGLIGLCGGLIAQTSGYADVNMGVGTIVIGLAAIILGEVLFSNLSLSARLFAVILGSICYRLVLLAVLQLGFSSDDFRLTSAIVLALCLLSTQFKAKFGINHLIKQGISKGGNSHD